VAIAPPTPTPHFCLGIMQIIEKMIALIEIEYKIIAYQQIILGISDSSGSCAEIP
jgi:hypothetical protein